MSNSQLTTEITFESLQKMGFQTDSIKKANTPEEWLEAAKLFEPAYCSYNFDDKMGTIYGHLFNWYAVNFLSNQPSDLFKIPNQEDFQKIQHEFGGPDLAGLALKSTDNWVHPDEENGEYGHGNNSSGFNIRPAGMINENGQFLGMNESAFLWSCTQDEWSDLAPLREYLNVSEENIVKNHTQAFAYGLSFYDNSFLDFVVNKECGLSLRLIKL